MRVNDNPDDRVGIGDNALVLRSRRAPYVVFAVLLIPLIVLGIFAALRTHHSTDVFGPLIPLIILLSFWGYLYSLRLSLDGDTIRYRVLWHSTEVALADIESIARRPKVLGLSAAWLIKRRDHAKEIEANVANVMPSDLKRFARLLRARAPQIRYIGLPN